MSTSPSLLLLLVLMVLDMLSLLLEIARAAMVACFLFSLKKKMSGSDEQ